MTFGTDRQAIDMSTKSELLKLLSENAGSFVSGEQIGESLGVSRAAISKACAALRSEGYDIESKTNNGYMLEKHENLLTETEIAAYVDVPCSLKVYDEVTSTNDLAKAEPAPDIPAVYIANRQSAGRGRLGRRFESPAGTGLYMTFSFQPDFDIRKSLFVTMASAVGTARAIEKATGKKAEIKWVNDLFYNGKKICGILTEAQSDFETGKIDKLVTGIGVNCFPGSFPEEIKHIAGSLSDKAGEFSRSRLAAEMINEIIPLITKPDADAFMDEYRERCFILGSEIHVHSTYSDNGVRAEALSVADDGGLIVRHLEGEKAGTEETLHTGEISISI